MCCRDYTRSPRTPRVCGPPGRGASWARAGAEPRRRDAGGTTDHDGTLEEPRLARADRRDRARARSADLRPAPSPVGPERRAHRPALSDRRDRGRPLRRPQHRVDGLHRVRSDVQEGRPGGAPPNRRDRVRERDRGDERLGPLRQDAHRRRHHRHSQPASGRSSRRRARRADRRGRRPVPRHPPRRGLGSQSVRAEPSHQPGTGAAPARRLPCGVQAAGAA